MSLLLALAAVGGTALGVNAECISAAAAAKAAGIASLSELLVYTEGSAAQAALADILTADTEVAGNELTTLFAPTDAAFKDAYSREHALDSIPLGMTLINHAAEGSLDAAELGALATEGKTFESDLGSDIEVIQDSEGDIYLAPVDTTIRARIVTSDIKTCAGMLHVIDAVLVPTEEVVEVAVAAEADDDQEEDARVAAEEAGLSEEEADKFVSAVVAGLVDVASVGDHQSTAVATGRKLQTYSNRRYSVWKSKSSRNRHRARSSGRRVRTRSSSRKSPVRRRSSRSSKKTYKKTYTKRAPKKSSKKKTKKTRKTRKTPKGGHYGWW